MSDSSNYIQIGRPKSETDQPIRIVHISDTHGTHWDILPEIPDGDILIHSGDFLTLRLSKFFLGVWDYKRTMAEVNKFFGKLPHKHKIFVAGNHEINFTNRDVSKSQSLLPNGIYLQDSHVTIEGIKIYGSPWNIKRRTSYARGFAIDHDKLDSIWKKIPQDTDVLVTHSPPYGIRDGPSHGWVCDKTDRSCHHDHMGCTFLRKHVMDRIKPKLHLFGHYHGANGIKLLDDTWFCNAALPKEINDRHKPVVIDYYVDDHHETRNTNTNSQENRCNTM